MAELLRFGAFEVEVQALATGQATARVRLGGAQYEVSELRRESGALSFTYAGQRYRFDVAAVPDSVYVADRETHYAAQRIVPGEAGGEARAGELVSRMPGKVLQLLVAPGTAVTAGTPLLILEAMKMEHQVVAPADGVLDGYPVAEGQRVQPGDLLADFTPAAV